MPGPEIEIKPAKIKKTLFDANTILKADVDDTPVALTIAEQRLLGRITSGVITALTATQIRTLLNVENGAAGDLTGAEIVALLEALAAIGRLSHNDGLSDLTTGNPHTQYTLKSLFDALKTNMIDAPLSPQIITGGVISEGSEGTVTISALTALLRSDTGATDPLTYVTLAEQANQTMESAGTKYYIVLTSTPAISIQETRANGTTEIGLGTCMKEADHTVHFHNAGMRLQNGVAKLHRRAATLRETELASGCAISDEGGASRQFGIASGVIYHGINRLTPFTPTAFDSGTNKFTYVYRDGADSWSYTADSTVIDNAQYYDGAYGLATLTTNRYGCHWVYLHPSDEHIYVVYGTTNGKLAEAEVAFAPSDLPLIISDFSLLLGCIIIEKNATAFTTIQMVTDVFFTGTAVADHGSLGGLLDDDHTQYTLKTQALMFALCS